MNSPYSIYEILPYDKDHQLTNPPLNMYPTEYLERFAGMVKD